jgi:hypothetical protein
MKFLAVGCVFALAAGAAFADHFIIGSKGSSANYPWRGC